VVEMSECPSRSLTTAKSAPPARSHEACVIRLGQPELLRARDELESRCDLADSRHGEEQIIRPQTVPLGMSGELGDDLRAELQVAVLFPFG